MGQMKQRFQEALEDDSLLREAQNDLSYLRMVAGDVSESLYVLATQAQVRGDLPTYGRLLTLSKRLAEVSCSPGNPPAPDRREELTEEENARPRKEVPLAEEEHRP